MPTLLPSVLETTGPLLADAGFYWHLPILIVVVSLVYSATRYDEWGPILREAVRWGLRLTVFLLVIAAVLYGLATWIN